MLLALSETYENRLLIGRLFHCVAIDHMCL
jgi:hypothetical protein